MLMDKAYPYGHLELVYDQFIHGISPPLSSLSFCKKIWIRWMLLLSWPAGWSLFLDCEGSGGCYRDSGWF